MFTKLDADMIIRWQESGEITAADLEQIKMAVPDMNNLVDSLVVYTKWNESNIACLKKQMAVMKAALDLLEKLHESLQETIKGLLDPLPLGEKRGTDFPCLLKASPPKLVIDNDDLLPSEYKKTKTTSYIDNQQIKTDLITGKEVSGAHIEVGKTLMIGKGK